MMNQRKKLLPISIILIVCLVTFLIWATMMPLKYRFQNYSEGTHSVGQLAGLLGTVLFALTFVLTTRLKIIEDAFSGLDKAYKAHHILGVISFVLLLFHPILLVLNFIPSNIRQAAVYLWPSNSWAVNYGIIALLSMILLISLTFYAKIKYRPWRISHKFMGLVFIIACFHIFLIPTDITWSPLLKGWMAAICAIGLGSHAYGSYLRFYLKKDFLYSVKSIKSSDNITTLELEPHSKSLNFMPGQFVFVSFDHPGLTEKHPFTIASAPGRTLKFMIKESGDFTKKIKEINKGASAHIEGPYGRLNATEDSNNQVWIAGGIGITPFLSFAEATSKKKDPPKIDLYYCVQNEKEALALDNLRSITKSHTSLRIILHCSDVHGRINSEVIEKKSGPLLNKNIYICGPISMMNSLEHQLIAKGVPQNKIHKEEFGFK